MIYSDIENMTNAEAVAYYGSLTASPIPCGDLENLLDWAGVAKRNAVSGAWEGSLIDFMNVIGIPALSEGLGELFSHLNKPRSMTIDTNTQPWGGKMSGLLAGLEQAGAINFSLTNSVVALAGGYAYPELDEAAVQAVRDQHAADEAEAAADAALQSEIVENATKWDALLNAHVNPLKDSGDYSDAAWIAALNAMASDWSN